MSNFIHIQKNIHHTPRKLRLVADLVRKMAPEQAIQTLRFTNKAAAIDLWKAIKAALANANNRPNLIFKHLEINEGLTAGGRWWTAGRGRPRRYSRRYSHIKVTLTDEVQPTAEIKNQSDQVIKQLDQKGDRS